MKEYLKKYRNRMILMGIFAFLIHGAKLNSEIIGIDTEDLIHLQGDFYGGWQNTGRQGLIALKWLTDSLTFRPYLAGTFTLVLFGLSASAFFLLWDKVIEKKIYRHNETEEQRGIRKWLPWVAGGLFLMSHPVITEQFYFTLQSVEICIGMLLTAVVLYLVTDFRKNGRIWKVIIGALILLLPFSIYQIFVVLFIFGTVSILLLEGLANLKGNEDVTAGKLLIGIIPYLSVFLTSFVVNTVITKLFFSSSDYLDGQILWGKAAITDNLRTIAGHVVRAMTGYQSVHYHFSFGLLCVMAIILILLLCFRYGKGKKGIVCVTLFYLAALLVTPFLMTLICGGAPAVRSQLVLPFLTGFLAYLNVTLVMTWRAVSADASVQKEKNEKQEHGTGKLQGAVTTFVAAICVVGIWGQIQTTMSLYYTDRMRYDQDAFLGRALITEIERVTGGEKMPVAVFGKIPFSGNNVCIEGEIIGKSFFDYDTEVEPKYYWSTRRILGFLHTLGADYPQVARERFGNAKIESDCMPAWPAEGSVQIRDRMLVIKLGEY